MCRIRVFVVFRSNSISNCETLYKKSSIALEIVDCITFVSTSFPFRRRRRCHLLIFILNFTCERVAQTANNSVKASRSSNAIYTNFPILCIFLSLRIIRISKFTLLVTVFSACECMQYAWIFRNYFLLLLFVSFLSSPI